MSELTDPLNSQERSRWRTLRKQVSGGRKAFWDYFGAVQEIRDRRLYREDFPNFDAFVAEEVGLGKRYVNRIIEASEARQRLGTIVPSVPEAQAITTEGQLRELKDVPDDQLEAVVEKAAVTASDRGKPITASMLAEARDEVMGEDAGPDELEPADEPLSDAEMALENASVGREIMSQLRAATKLIKQSPEGAGLETLHARKRSIISHIENAVSEVSVSIPKAICPRCSGEKCPQCGNHGWVNSILLRELKG